MPEVPETTATQEQWKNLKLLYPQQIQTLRINLNVKDARRVLKNRREWNVVFARMVIASLVLPCQRVHLMRYVSVEAPHGIETTVYMLFQELRVQRLLVRMGNVETDVESFKERVETLENRELVSNDQIKGLVNEKLAERKEVEARRLNLVCLNLPESRREDSKDRQEEDLVLFVKCVRK